MLCPRISAREEIQRFHVHTARVRICIAHAHTQTHVSCRRRSIIYYYYFCSSLIVRRWISLVPVKHSLTARGHVLGIHLHTQKTAGWATISTTTTAAAGGGGGADVYVWRPSRRNVSACTVACTYNDNI